MKEEGRWRTAFFCGVLGCMGEGSWLVGLVWFFLFVCTKVSRGFFGFFGGAWGLVGGLVGGLRVFSWVGRRGVIDSRGREMRIEGVFFRTRWWGLGEMEMGRCMKEINIYLQQNVTKIPVSSQPNRNRNFPLSKQPQH